MNKETVIVKGLRWTIGAIIFIAVIILIFFKPLPFLFYHDLPFIAFFRRAFFIIILACVLCLYRIAKGPTGADRIVAIDILGIMVIGLCSLLSITTGRSWYLDIGIVWALQSFISTLALSKYLEGRGFEE